MAGVEGAVGREPLAGAEGAVGRESLAGGEGADRKGTRLSASHGGRWEAVFGSKEETVFD